MPLDLDALKPVALWRYLDTDFDGPPVMRYVVGDHMENDEPFVGLDLATYSALVEELRAAMEALAFYADATHYHDGGLRNGSIIYPSIYKDGGVKARAALSGGAS